MAGGDLIAQFIEQKIQTREERAPRFIWDGKRTGRLSLYGAGILGPSLHYWYCIILDDIIGDNKKCMGIDCLFFSC